MKNIIYPRHIYIITILILIIIYYSSIFHLPRADHWNILLHTLGVNELGTLIKKSYSYARQCLIAPGDVVLFRPLQSSFLAIEKYLFNPNSIFPQLINVILHIIIFALVNYLLFLWFNLIDTKDKIFKYTIFLLPVITSFFILNFAIIELVIWASLKGYLIFLIFILFGFIFLTKVISNPQFLNLKYLIFSWTFFLFATFTYEFGQFVCIIVGITTGVLLFNLKNTKSALLTTASFILIFFIYRTINAIDYNLHTENIKWMQEFKIPTGENIYIYSEMIRSIFSFPTIKNFWTIFSSTTVTPFFPFNSHLYIAEKVVIFKPFSIHMPNLNIAAIPSLIMMITWFFLFIRGTIKGFKSKNLYFKYFFSLITFIYLAFLLITVLGRMNLRGDYSSLENYSYYNYMGFGFLTILSSLAIYYNSQNISKFLFLQKTLLSIFLVSTVIVTIMSSIIIFKINNQMLQNQAYLRIISAQIEDFINLNQKDDKIKLAFDIDNSDYTPMIPGAGIPKIYLFFYEHLSLKNPDYFFKVKNRKVHFYTKEEYNNLFGRNDYLDLILKKNAHSYKIYENNNIFYGVPYWFLTYDPKTDVNDLIIIDKNINNIIKQVPKKMMALYKRVENGEIESPHNIKKITINKNYKDFIITKYSHWYFATPKEDESFMIESINKNVYKEWFSSTSLEELYKILEY